MALSVDDDVEKRKLTEHRNELDCILSRLERRTKPVLGRSMQQQLEAQLRTIRDLGIHGIVCAVDQNVEDAYEHLRSVRGLIQARLGELDALGGASETASDGVPTEHHHNQRVAKFEKIASRGKLEAVTKEILRVSRSTWYLYKRLQLTGKRRIKPEKKAAIDAIIDGLEFPD